MDYKIEHDDVWQRALGDNTRLGEWLDRAAEAAQLIRSLPLEPGQSVIDLGCGRQSLRSLLPAELRYIPVDVQPRSEDTFLADLNGPGPEGRYDVAVMLGVLEYLAKPLDRLDWFAAHARFAVFSYVDCSNKRRNRCQHWIGCVSFQSVEQRIAELGGRILKRSICKKGTRMYVLEFPSPSAEPA